MHFKWLHLTLTLNEILQEICCVVDFFSLNCFFQGISSFSSISHCFTYFLFAGGGNVLPFPCIVILKDRLCLCPYVKFSSQLAAFICRYFYSSRKQVMLKDAGCVIEHYVL